MSWGTSVAEFAKSMREGYQFVEDVRTQDEERKMSKARREGIEFEYSDEMKAAKRRQAEAIATRSEFEASEDYTTAQLEDMRSGSEYRRATIPLTKAQAERAAYENTEGYREREARATEASTAGTEAQAEYHTQSARKLKTETDLSEKINRIKQGVLRKHFPDLPEETKPEEALRTGLLPSDPVTAGQRPAYQTAFLRAIGGGESGHDYNIRYTPSGGKKFGGTEHPRIFEPGPHGPSSAAGYYQFTASTWDDVGGGPFTEEAQDERAWQLAQDRYRAETGEDLDAELQTNGLTPKVMSALAPTWAAFKGNHKKHINEYNRSLERLSGFGGPESLAGSAGGDFLTSSKGAVREGALLLAQAVGEAGGAVDDGSGAGDAEVANILTGGDDRAATDEDMRDIKRAIQKEAGGDMPEEALNLALVDFAYTSAMLDGDAAKAASASAAALMGLQRMYGQYSALAKAAASKGELDKGIDAMVRAYAQIPDGYGVKVTKQGENYVVQQTDALTGKVVGEKTVMSPDEVFQTIMRANPSDFANMLVIAGSKDASANISERTQAAIEEFERTGNINIEGVPTNEVGHALRAMGIDESGKRTGGGGGTKWSDVENISGAAEQGITIAIDTAFNGDTDQAAAAIPPADRARLTLLTEGILRRAGPDMPPAQAGNIAMSLTAVDEQNPMQPSHQQMIHNEDGTFTYIIPRIGPVTISAEDNILINAVRGRRIKELMKDSSIWWKPVEGAAYIGEGISKGIGGLMDRAVLNSQRALGIPTE